MVGAESDNEVAPSAYVQAFQLQYMNLGTICFCRNSEFDPPRHKFQDVKHNDFTVFIECMKSR
jgi:hypothetical protein